jgi:YidC/Oxa1 family membrane protein insertase
MLNAIHGVLPNYGVAIMLLTVVIRIVFWPLTHKSSQSMKRMAELQPLVKELQEKYKKDPQRMQQEMMRLYKEHKVNPVAGCLPMLIQIPSSSRCLWCCAAPSSCASPPSCGSAT